ncbi:MAG: YraN family protein [Candidatus Pacebacteria bacterium]|nr:YraN family protein [Candidatus Paceibacterota bacterium]
MKLSLDTKEGLFNRKNLGSYGEKATEFYLISKGHKVLGRNVRLKRGEIDILTFYNSNIHIFEVKTVYSGDFGTESTNMLRNNNFLAEENLSRTKILKLRRLRLGLLSLLDSRGGDYDSSDSSVRGIFRDLRSVYRNRGLDIFIHGFVVEVYSSQIERKITKIKVRSYSNL